ncbi:SAICAR synthase-like protein [Fistulina hepatica ATCC 64428]|nr:SAICAR synthase-like protein [Fistulina hepatica ATCC 64428]
MARRLLDSQVGGHTGVETTEDDSLIIKPCLPLELEFYQAISSSTEDNPFTSLRRYIPNFLGTLKLEGQMSDGSNVLPLPEVGRKDDYRLTTQSIVLENLSYPFLRPNIMDIKLGTVLFDETAPPEKVERMIHTAKTTTSLETGVRLTGFQVHSNETGRAVGTPKSYGKSIQASQLPEGIAKFFPVAPSPTESSGLSSQLLVPILKGIMSDVTAIQNILKKIDMRMVGGSILIVYEGDWERATVALQKLRDRLEKNTTVGPPYVVKLIDFAHTRLTPGQGPDLGVLLGLDTLINLLRGRITELESPPVSK